MSQKKAHSSDILGSSDEEVSSAARTSRLADIPEIFVIGGPACPNNGCCDTNER